MNESLISSRQAASLSAALGLLYQQPGERGVIEHGMDAIDMLVGPSCISVELFLPDGGGVQHLADRRLTLLPVTVKPAAPALKAHPGILPLEKHPRTPLRRMTDLVRPREPQELPPGDPAGRLEGWADQIALVCPTAQGVVTFALNNGHRYRDEEHMAMLLFEPHLSRVLNRDALYAYLPAAVPLTQREREVLHWLVQGKRDEEIAILLRCGQRTISQHVRALLRKLGVENRTSAALMVVQNTAAPPPEPPGVQD